MTYIYKGVEYARFMNNPQDDPVAVQKEILSNSSRPFTGEFSTGEETDSVVNGRTLTFSNPRLSPTTATDPLAEPRLILQRGIAQTQDPGTTSQEELFSQSTGKPLQK